MKTERNIDIASVRVALRMIKNNKSAGICEKSNDMLQADGEEYVKWMIVDERYTD